MRANPTPALASKVSLAATAALLLSAAAAPAWAQQGGMGPTPLAVDLKKAPIGTWAEYQVTIGSTPAKTRWALVDRKAGDVTIEMAVEGAPATQLGGKMTMKMLMAADATKSDRPVKQLVMQIEGRDPMEMPQQGPVQRFEKPDPKKLVAKETIKVMAGSFPTSHYRDSNERGTIDMWISETIPPLGLVKLELTPKSGSSTPPVKMELSNKGKDAKPTVTKAPKPFDPAVMMGAAPPPAAPAPAPAPKK